jgi:hypothetical protein
LLRFSRPHCPLTNLELRRRRKFRNRPRMFARRTAVSDRRVRDARRVRLDGTVDAVDMLTCPNDPIFASNQEDASLHVGDNRYASAAVVVGPGASAAERLQWRKRYSVESATVRMPRRKIIRRSGCSVCAALKIARASAAFTARARTRSSARPLPSHSSMQYGSFSSSAVGSPRRATLGFRSSITIKSRKSMNQCFGPFHLATTLFLWRNVIRRSGNSRVAA